MSDRGYFLLSWFADDVSIFFSKVQRVGFLILISSSPSQRDPNADNAADKNH
jgi:hypothetical protein